ncbi:MAG TPA: hypothetical protein GXX39_11620 [Syntrophothermus lipocalidus]|nr:hypothetical protein [Syntrophothermus lipocalidus]
MIVVLESTTYPGTTEELFQVEVEKAGFRAIRYIIRKTPRK